ncbi:MAG: F0F1 ATP synthase subunit delta [Pseudomonadales bacterium]|nr:F0F1 ATP synthase subunit delta [Candidatus Woesebacteria bacterium]MCB9800703.1 F0F1 ATP synthase subunit delta [Pseudomonadales bacterium]
MKSTDLTITVATAITLSSSQEKAIEKAVKEKRNVSSVTIEKIVDPKLIGGIKLTINSVEYDGTVAGKLAKLKSQLMSQL